MRKALMLLSLALFAVTLVPVSARAEGAKQPVFLMCPHQKKYSAWSVYVNVDAAGKVTALGLDKLPGANSVDMDGFSAVHAAAAKGGTPCENLGTLSAAEFGKGRIRIEKDDALHLGVEPVDAETLKLVLSMRCTSDKRFNINGKEKDRNILIKYDKATKKWGACAQKLKDANGQELTGGTCLPILGINFPVTGTGIYRIVGVFENGEAAILVDGWGKPGE